MQEAERLRKELTGVQAADEELLSEYAVRERRPLPAAVGGSGPE